jgi:outer membrane lipoprotein-sorting protein
MKLMGLGSVLQRPAAAFVAMAVLCGAANAAVAADAAVSADKPAVNAVTGSAWQSEIKTAEPAAENNLPPEQQAVVDKINAYLQTFTDLEGQFVQTNPDNAVQKGTFWMLRPGMMRFDYAKPSEMRIVCDGKYLSIEDHDLKTVNRYPIETTPFRMLLVKDVKLERDTRIISVSSSDTSATVTLADKTGQSAGQIQLFFSYPNIELKEWTITDAQGLNTRIEVAGIQLGKSLSADLFAPSQLGLAKAFGDR